MALLSGCASVPMTSESEDLAAKQFAPPAGKAHVYVYRGGGVGTAVVAQTILDGRITGSLAPNTYELLIVSPGSHVLTTSGGFENVEQVNFQSSAGQNYFFKLGLGMGLVMPRVSLKQVDEETGREAVRGSKRAQAATY